MACNKCSNYREGNSCIIPGVLKETIKDSIIYDYEKNYIENRISNKRFYCKYFETVSKDQRKGK